MQLFLTGGTGFIGRALCLRLARDGHSLRVWTRSPQEARDTLGPDVELIDAGGGAAAMQQALEGCDAVVNLAGEPVIDGRWTAARKRGLVSSRVALTDALVDAMVRCERPPRALVSASAVGFYGSRGDAWLDEDSEPGDGFLAKLCCDWEAAAQRAAARGVRVALVRVGVMLGFGGGALAPMLPAFRVGLGGPFGSGRQYISWIHLHDLVEVLATAVVDERYRGPINGVAPNPVSNGAFVRALAATLSRPASLRLPGFALALLLGDRAGVVLASQRVNPVRLSELGFRFRFETVDRALADIAGMGGDVEIRHATEQPDSVYLRERGGARYRLRQVTVVDAPLEDVFSFFSKAENLGAITPPDVRFSLLTPRPIEMRRGSEIEYRIVLGPAQMSWRTVIDAWEPGERFVDSQHRGPYRSWWHEHRFRALGERTVVEDLVYYSPPLGVLGRIAHRLFIAGKLRQIFGYRATAIALRFGARPISVASAA